TNPIPVVDAAIGDQSAVDNETVSIASSISDPDGDVLSYTATGLPTGLSIDPSTGVISGTIDNSASQTNGGVYPIVVSATDADGDAITDSFALSVTNPAPTAADDALSGDENTALTSNVITASDSDPDGDVLSVSEVNGDVANVGAAIAGSSGGLFTIDANGDISFDPNGEYEGLDVGESATSTVSYQISDGEGGFDTAIVTATIQGANDVPVVTGTLTGQSGTDSAALLPFDASTVFSDVDGETLAYTATDLPSWMSINPATGVITGTPP
ncbi:putative Ig domain-containing protein, partial [Litorimonas cladophorae]|uniref:putative Ig domain-containing protein n=1 Tax=Litorimonas cladophorae TaxID=1220491 RepID=UPI00167BBAA1